MPINDQSPVSRAELFEKTRWADDFSWHEIRTLSHYLVFNRVRKEDQIVREGDTEAFLCIIVNGSVNVVKKDSDEHQKKLSVIRSGETFGEMSLFDDEPRSASIIAAEDTEMLILTNENLALLISERPGLGAKLLLKLGRILSRRLRLASGKLIDHLG